MNESKEEREINYIKAGHEFKTYGVMFSVFYFRSGSDMLLPRLAKRQL